VSPDADAPAPKPGTVAARRAAASRGPAAPRRRETPRARPAPPAEAPAPASAPLEGERDERTAFLLQSLRDLEREHAAGDLSDEDFAALRDDYTARAAAALRAEERGKAPPPPVKRRRSPTQWALIVAGIVGFAVLAGILVAQASGERGAGDGITGEVTQTPTQAASECIGLTVELQAGTTSLDDVVPCYEAVLDDDPDNAVARTYLGWTLYLTAQQAAEQGVDAETLVDVYVQARRQLDLAVEADPAYADARAFSVVLAVNEGRYEEAADQLEAFDALDVPADMAALVDRVRPEIEDGLAAGDDTTTTTTVPG
jgi:tetratricopeptide (TPR) repeat protein